MSTTRWARRALRRLLTEARPALAAEIAGGWLAEATQRLADDDRAHPRLELARRALGADRAPLVASCVAEAIARCEGVTTETVCERLLRSLLQPTATERLLRSAGMTHRRLS